MPERTYNDIKHMIMHVETLKYNKIFTEIYNNANTLFPEGERGDAPLDLFACQLTEDENVVEITETGKVRGFASYHRFGAHTILTSLYVRREEMHHGVGRRLLLYCEEQVPAGGFWFVKVLKHAPWAQGFYLKNGYLPLDAERKELAASLKMVPKAWSMVLWKRT